MSASEFFEIPWAFFLLGITVPCFILSNHSVGWAAVGVQVMFLIMQILYGNNILS